MAKEYIDRKAAVAALIGDETVHIPTLLFAQKRIEAIPAADVVEVVRCRDCKYRHDDNFCVGRGWPEQLVPDDGYCDKGAKMEGEE